MSDDGEWCISNIKNRIVAASWLVALFVHGFDAFLDRNIADIK